MLAFLIAGGIKMAEKVDRRVRKTKAQLRAGLARSYAEEEEY